MHQLLIFTSNFYLSFTAFCIRRSCCYRNCSRFMWFMFWKKIASTPSSRSLPQWLFLLKNNSKPMKKKIMSSHYNINFGEYIITEFLHKLSEKCTRLIISGTTLYTHGWPCDGVNRQNQLVKNSHLAMHLAEINFNCLINNSWQCVGYCWCYTVA